MTQLKVDEMIILAGGLGSRLRSVVSDVPKPMAPINGYPFLEYLMDYWIDQGIKHFTLSVGYLAEKIKSYFGDEYRGCSLRYVLEENPLGTGGGLRQVILASSFKNKYVLVANGDTWYEVDLKNMLKDSSSLSLPITMALKPILENDRYGGVLVDELGRVVCFGVITEGECLINGGCYLIDTVLLKEKLRDFPEKFSLEQDMLVDMALKGELAASLQNHSFLDIGLPHDYQRAAEILAK